MNEKGFKLKMQDVSKEDFNRTYKKVICDQQKQIDSCSVRSENHFFNTSTNSQFDMYDLTNLYSLHDPFDLNHLQGLRNRLFIKFNEFANILKNALLPPVLKNVRKIHIQTGEWNQQTITNNLFNLNLLVSEIKKESRNENLHSKNKTNTLLRKQFQIKLAQCYKLAINITKMCSKTLEANIYNPIQCKIKNLIQTISTLSITTGKYIYGDLYKKKEKESYDLVQRCKVLNILLDEVDYKDTENDDYSSYHEKNVLNELANKALNKTKTKLFTTNFKQLNMYNQAKPKLGSYCTQNSAKKLTDLANQKQKDSKMFCHKIENVNIVSTYEVTNSPTSTVPCITSNKLKSINNVGMYTMKENVWKKFPIKSTSCSLNGNLILSITPDHAEDIYSYKRQFEQLSIKYQHQMDTIFNIAESVLEDLINEVISKIYTINDVIINELLRSELF